MSYKCGDVTVMPAWSGCSFAAVTEGSCSLSIFRSNLKNQDAAGRITTIQVCFWWLGGDFGNHYHESSYTLNMVVTRSMVGRGTKPLKPLSPFAVCVPVSETYRFLWVSQGQEEMGYSLMVFFFFLPYPFYKKKKKKMWGGVGLLQRWRFASYTIAFHQPFWAFHKYCLRGIYYTFYIGTCHSNNIYANCCDCTTPCPIRSLHFKTSLWQLFIPNFRHALPWKAKTTSSTCWKSLKSFRIPWCGTRNARKKLRPRFWRKKRNWKRRNR